MLAPRLLEIQSSGRRQELRFLYRHQDLVFSETFNVNLADDTWHKIALTVSGAQVDVHIDCVHRYKRPILAMDRQAFAAPNLTVWLGQQGLNRYLYKVSVIEQYRLASASFDDNCFSKMVHTN